VLGGLLDKIAYDAEVSGLPYNEMLYLTYKKLKAFYHRFRIGFFLSSSLASAMTDIYTVGPFKVIGVSVRTTNADAQAVMDLGALWNRFYSQGISAQIPGKADNDVYAIYTDYNTDHKGAYTAIIGCKVTSLANIPDGMTGKQIEGGRYRRYVAKGKMPHAVIRQWQEIWNDTDLPRMYSADFEVYGPKSGPDENAEVEICIAVK
jgi:predicted transcriptional regulator YdeE